MHFALDGRRLDVLGPQSHELAPLVKQIPPTIRRFGLIPHGVGQKAAIIESLLDLQALS